MDRAATQPAALRRQGWLRPVSAWILGLAVWACAQAAAAQGAAPEAATPASAAAAASAPAALHNVGQQVCVSCHVLESKNFAHTTHAKVFGLNPKNETEKQGCEACHGPGSRHIANVSDRTALISFTREWGTPVARQNQQCMSCHVGGQRIHWAGSAHERQALACSDCHNPMARFSATGLLKNASISETCYSCHQQQRAEFRKRSHMPLPEGKMSCEDCHNPHGSITRPLLKADSVNATCYACHAEKRGPFIWEHAPVRESCLNCHTPHGSNNDKLLAVARPQLCQQCHTSTRHPNDLFTRNQLPGGNVENINERLLARSCQNCHTQIHGSNSPDGARFHR
jgi:DmsE family decaheme c-type cytochrome